MAGPAWLRQMLRRLGRDERGNAAMIFGLCALPLAAGAGLAIDTLLAYSVEDQLQKSLDAAGLAAGRTALPENVEADARSYFTTNFTSGPRLATLDADDLQIEVSEVGDELVLSATAVMPTRFMRLFGQDTVTVAATTVINREIRQMELALVLDNTGSMWGAPFTAMQTAAKDLVDIVYGDVETNPNLFVAVVPFVANVNIGSQHWDWLQTADPQRRYRSGESAVNPYAPSTWKGCVMARAGGLDQTDDPPSVAAFSSFLYPDDTDNDWGAPRNPPTDERLNARNDAYGPNLGCGPAILPLVQSKATVDASLDGMGAWSRGGTSGNEGLAWGWRVLSPRWRGLWGGDTPNTRPLDYDASDTDKVVVMLTDGNNEVYDHPPTGPRGSDYTAFGRLNDPSFMGPGRTRAQGVTEWNTRMGNVCARMKNEGIIIYTITFGATPSVATQNLYRNCATRSEFYYHSPDNATLRSVFRSIGVQLSNLRIAQ
jgi:Flp pilus assembly protein TadG